MNPQSGILKRYILPGFIETIPLGIGVTIYGLVYGMMSRQSNIPLWVVLGLSLIVFAGSSQMVAVDMIASGAGVLPVMITVLTVNLRHIVMAADISRFTGGSSARSKVFSAFFLTDEAYAVSYSHFQKCESGGTAYVFGCGLNIYLFWSMSGVIGYFCGTLLPELFRPALGFAMAAAFLSMLIPIIKNRSALAAVITSAIVAVAGNMLLPGKWYIILAALAGSVVGYLFSGLRPEKQEAGDGI